MSLLFNPKTLNLLLKFKKTGNKRLIKHILFLILDNTYEIELSFLQYLLFSHTDLDFKDIEKYLEDTIKQNFIRKNINGIPICFIKKNILKSYCSLIKSNRLASPSRLGNCTNENWIDQLVEVQEKENLIVNKENVDATSNNNRDMAGIELCCNFSKKCINAPDDNNLKSIKSNAINVKKHSSPNYKNLNNKVIINCSTSQASLLDISTEHNNLDPSSVFIPSSCDVETIGQEKTVLTPKKDKAQQQNTLNFTKVQTNKSVAIEKFAPLSLKNATFIYNRHDIVYDTQRKRDDLINPTPLQFIKHFDQCKPPIYRKKGILKRAIFSDRRIPGVLTYDEESSEDWEECEDSLSNESVSEESEEVGDEDWVEKDSEDVEVSRYNKKPCFIFKEVQIETYFEKERYLKANLILSDQINEGIIDEFRKFRESFTGTEQEMNEQFSNLYNVTMSGISEII